MSKNFYLGIDWGGSKIALALTDSSDAILWRTGGESGRVADYEDELNKLSSLIERAAAFASENGGEIVAIGCAVAAQIRADDGYILGAPNLGLKDVPLADDLSRLTGINTIIENDVNAAAFGEYGANPGDGDPFLAVFVGTGVGGGLVIGGEIYRGVGGSAGEIGHIPVQPMGAVCGCGARGCVEAYAGGAAVGRRAKAALDFGRARILREAGYAGQLPNLSEIAQAADAGDPDCALIIEEAEYALAAGLATAINLLNPATVALGGGVIEGYPAFADAVWRRTEAMILPSAAMDVTMRKSVLWSDAAPTGAARLARLTFDSD
jgi:glucokinase